MTQTRAANNAVPDVDDDDVRGDANCACMRQATTTTATLWVETAWADDTLSRLWSQMMCSCVAPVVRRVRHRLHHALHLSIKRSWRGDLTYRQPGLDWQCRLQAMMLNRGDRSATLAVR